MTFKMTTTFLEKPEQRNAIECGLVSLLSCPAPTPETQYVQILCNRSTLSKAGQASSQVFNLSVSTVLEVKQSPSTQQSTLYLQQGEKTNEISES